MVMQATDPETGEVRYFVDKNLPFGASISCLVFQRFSNGLSHIFKFISGQLNATVNYLDDFLFLHKTEAGCNRMVRQFIELCNYLGVPIAEEKTEWANTRTVFLRIMLDGYNHVLCIPEEKRLKAVNMLTYFIKKRKAMVHEMESLAGFLNFLSKAIHPGRVFTRRMYVKFKHTSETLQLRKYHRVKLDEEFKDDCRTWLSFLMEGEVNLKICRPWVDFENRRIATRIEFYTDASGSLDKGGFGGHYKNSWMAEKWNSDFMHQKRPSIEFLELFAVTACMLKWLNSAEFCNTRLEIYCDNETVCRNINDTTASCKNSMRLLRLIVRQGLENNCRIFTVYVSSRNNDRADALSRGQFDRFWTLSMKKGVVMNPRSDAPPSTIWPPENFWID